MRSNGIRCFAFRQLRTRGAAIVPIAVHVSLFLARLFRKLSYRYMNHTFTRFIGALTPTKFVLICGVTLLIGSIQNRHEKAFLHLLNWPCTFCSF